MSGGSRSDPPAGTGRQARRPGPPRSRADRLLDLLAAAAGIWAAAALVLAVLVALAVTLAFILVMGLAVASAAPRAAAAPVMPSAAAPVRSAVSRQRPALPGRYIPVRENPAVAGAGRWRAGSTTSVVQPALPSGPAALTR